MKIDIEKIKKGPHLAEVLAYGPKPAVNLFGSFRSDLAAYLRMRGFVRMVADPDWKEMRLFHDDTSKKEARFLWR